VARRATPHPFLWLLIGALALAIVAAALASGRAQAFALYWNPIYRAEIALVVLALVYLLGTTGWMAWHGQSFRRIELPGGAALERDAAEHDPLAAARAHLARSKALREKTEYHGKAVVRHLRRYAELRREAARRGR
jgi:hypothetical protein